MIKVHHLNQSRSTRVLWMLEELGLDYEIVAHERDAKTRLAPPSLKAVHPLGKAPVLEDGELKIAESAAIIEYLIETYGQGQFRPASGTDDYWRYVHFLHFAESSAMLPLMLFMYTNRLGDAGKPLHERIFSEIDNHFSYLNAELEGRDFLAGDSLTGADVQNIQVLENPYAMGLLEQYANLKRYVEAMHARPAYQRAIEKGGTPVF
jgi:glutathione S-transferase